MSVHLEPGQAIGGERRKKKRFVWLPYQLLLPSVLLLLLINFYPFISGLLYSFKDGTVIKPGSFVGFSHYAELLRLPDFWNAISFSAVFSITNVIGSYVIGLALALMLNIQMPGRAFFRVALLVPWIVPSIVSIVDWRWMIGDQNGLVNMVIKWLGFDPIFFLAEPHWAIFSVCMIKIWRSFPFMMITLLAGLQTIDQSLYESAGIDGAGKWKSFWHITLPQLKTMSVVSWVLMIIYSFNDFDTIYLLTGGGPVNSTENLILLAYRYTFTKNDLGSGSAMAIVALIILFAAATFLLRRQAGHQVEELHATAKKA